MKKFIRTILIVFIILLLVTGWLLLGPATAFTNSSAIIYVHSNQHAKQEVVQQLKEKNILQFPSFFLFAANQANVWERLKPGRFEIKKQTNLLQIIRMLRNNSQSPVKWVINKLRTKEDFAAAVGKNFSTDSLTTIQFITNNDSLKTFGVDTNTFLTLVIPNTYMVYWTTPLKKILFRLQTEQDKFWQANNRKEQAKQLGFTPQQIYILASIVEEETNKNDEKDTIASVYINRLKIGMPLAADPTVKFALKDFSIKRIRFNHLLIASPYNTYRNKGLPPGPICTPLPATIDAVLRAPSTTYLYFVAKSDFSGYHKFSSTYAEHLSYAQQYQQALDNWEAKQQKP